MPDEMQSERLRKYRTSFPHERFELQTLQLQQRRLDIADELDIVFVMDTTSTMGDFLNIVADSLAGVASGIAAEFSSVRYAVIGFKYSAQETVKVTGSNFVDLASAQLALNSLVFLPDTIAFQLLTLTYTWGAQPDLDTATIFQGETVGFAYGGTANYMTFSGDDETAVGSEIITVDLETAFAENAFVGNAKVVCCADWFPPPGGSGPATLTVNYNGANQVFNISPPSTGITPSSTVMLELEIGPYGLVSWKNGYGALYEAAKMPWREDAAKAVVLISDIRSHERVKKYQTCKTELLRKDCVLFSGIGLNDPDEPPYYGYDSLVLATGGLKLTGETSETITSQIVAVLKAQVEPLAPPIYLVNDSVSFVAMLETGVEVTFENRSFEINTNISGEDGAMSVSLTIDNTDFAVSRYLAKARKHHIPLEVVLRIYFNDDSSEPQNEPVRLFATDFETKGSIVSCQVRWLDLQNSPFPNAFYSPQRCPSLQ